MHVLFKPIASMLKTVLMATIPVHLHFFLLKSVELDIIYGRPMGALENAFGQGV